MATAFAVVALLGPGLGLQRLVRVRIDPALALPLGAAWAALAYAVSLAGGAAWLFPALVAAAALPLVAGLRLVEDVTPWRALVAPALALVALLAVTQYDGNRHAADGSFRLDPMGDQPLHAGIAWELTIGWPPQVPGLAGVPLRYHVGADLVRAAAVRWAGTTPYGLLNRLEPTLWALGLMLALAALVRRIGGGPLAQALAAGSVLACDLSFLWAPLRHAEWWSDVFRGNLLISLAFTNPVVPGLMLAAGALLAVSRFEAGEGRGWLSLAVAQAAAVPIFKVFLGAQLGLALGLAAIALFLRTRDRGGLRRAAPALLLALAALPGVAWLAGGSGGEQIEVRLAPLHMVRDSLANLHYDAVSSGVVAAAALPWLVVSLGLRVVGLAPALQALRRGGTAGAAAAALALSGWPLGLLFHAAAHDIDGRELPSAAIYFVEQSGAVLWLFTALALGAWAGAPRRRALVLASAAVLAFPSTLEFAVRKARLPADVVPAAYVEAVQAVAKEARPGDRVLQRPGARYPPLPAVLAPQRVLYERFTPYLSQFAPAAELRRRHEALFRFFRTTDRQEARAIARSLQARYLCLYDGDRIRFDGSGWLVPLHEEAGARSYRVVDTDAPPSSPQSLPPAPIR
ncbi:MAG TPA: hypothetical protein VMX54_01200 [Vicinamibacteria bacterium]|nr:hypothetical protein [Vicinamibacteria bacterium]